jgi:hypothetical protein
MYENETKQDVAPAADIDSELVGWVMTRIDRWRSTRDTNFLKDWEKYYRIWKGEWDPSSKTRDMERSKLISPATQQAVDSMVAEMSEATFGKGMWFDVEDNDDPQQLAASQLSRKNLLDDFDRDAIPTTIRESYLLGAIYGTGIAKRVIGSAPAVDPTGANPDSAPVSAQVFWDPIPPYNFVIDTAAKNVETALGCAHETIRPMHEIEAKQLSGEYLPGAIGTASGHLVNQAGSGPSSTDLEVEPSDGTAITEYHGLVPARFFEAKKEDVPEPMKGMEEEDDEENAELEHLVEAVITIGNGSTLLKKVVNRFDRGIIAYQHDIVPNRFWGRGIPEKAYNAQAALDAQLRARIDALGLMTYPVMGADATRLPRGLNLKIQPGKTFLTNGRPSEVIEPINFGNLSPESFQQTGDLERMVQMATGSYDAASEAALNPSRSTSGGMSMAISSMIKRAKMTMFNVDQSFLDPLVRKSILVYRELEPDRYPIDTVFTVNSSMSIMAREFEQTQMTNLLSIIPPEVPAYMMVLRTIIENYSGPSKDKLVASIDDMMKPDPEKEQMEKMKQQLEMQAAMAEVQKLQLEGKKLESEIALNMAKTQKELKMADLEDEKVDIEAARVVIEDRQTRVQEEQLTLNEKEIEVKKKEANAKPKPSK